MDNGENMQESLTQMTALYTHADLRRLACTVLGKLDGIAIQPLESDIQVESRPEGLYLDCRVVACFGRPLLQLGRSAQHALTEAIQAVSAHPVCEIRIIIDDLAPTDSLTKRAEE